MIVYIYLYSISRVLRHMRTDLKIKTASIYRVNNNKIKIVNMKTGGTFTVHIALKKNKYNILSSEYTLYDYYYF